MNIIKNISCLILVCLNLSLFANKITDGYNALSIFDYFKAKKIFENTLLKFPTEASFGLATIYSRHDNPFSNCDSAAKYIDISGRNFKDTTTLASFHINASTIQFLANNVAKKGFENFRKINTINAYENFLYQYPFAADSIKQLCYLYRDSLAYARYYVYKSSDSIHHFLLTYPQTTLYNKAKNDYYNFQFQEQVPVLNTHQLKLFLKKFPENNHVVEAELSLFELTKQEHQPDSLYGFILKYSTHLTKEQAWKTLYSLSVKNYSKEELSRFVIQYPDYPYHEALQKEISLAQKILIPLKDKNDKFGYIDTLGHWILKPQFDDADFYYEGFAAVCKNDSCFYINKEGLKTSDYYFEEVESYANGVAIVKKASNYFIINRSGQLISKGFDDINQMFDNLFVCKSKDNYGAINAKGETIIPFNYHKLGNFKNGYAYYLSSHYGLVNTLNHTLKAEWDWISDVDTNHIVIVKKENKFGLMRTNEQILITPQFDYITPCLNDIYLVVKNGLYGFYNSSEMCFITSIEYDYNKAYDSNYYTNGKYFKLLKDNEVALIDANGRYSISFGIYSNLFFAKCDVIRIQKNNKYGFVDRKLKVITPVDFDKASDFENDVAIVSKSEKKQLINKEGKILFTIKDGDITRMSSQLYQIEFKKMVGLINEKGDVILPIDYDSINAINKQIYRCQKPDGSLFIFNVVTKHLVKL